MGTSVVNNTCTVIDTNTDTLLKNYCQHQEEHSTNMPIRIAIITFT